MLDGLRVLLRALNAVRLQGYVYIWSNLAFVILSLPLITAPAAFSALMHSAYISQTQAHEADLGLFWETFRSNLWRALPWGIFNALFGVILISNLLRDGDSGSAMIQAWQILRSGVLFTWLSSIVYTWPLYYEMENPSWAGAQRNAILMVIQNPFFTLVLFAGSLLLALISTIMLLPWILLTWGCIAAIGGAAVVDRLHRYRTHTRKA